MRFDDEGNIYIRQSWLDDFIRDPRRAQFGIIHPDMDGPSDATSLGTAAHAGVEYTLNCISNHDAHDHGVAVAEIEKALDEELAQPNVKWNKYDSRAELLSRAITCYHAWFDGILPSIPFPGVAEHKFCVQVMTLPDGRKVFIEGTIDWVCTDRNAIWDWKFPGRDYRQVDKQKSAIQPTIYTLAAVLGGMSDITDFEYSYPMDFTYGIGVTLKTKARPEMFTVRRNWGHAAWAMERISQAIDLALNYGFERPWPANDDHFLCSDKWCPWWDMCKGQHVSWRDLKVPLDLKKKD